jgi:hypothetical protein
MGGSKDLRKGLIGLGAGTLLYKTVFNGGGLGLGLGLGENGVNNKSLKKNIASYRVIDEHYILMKLACFEKKRSLAKAYMNRLEEHVRLGRPEIIKGSTKDIELRRELLMENEEKKEQYMTILFEVIKSQKIVVADYTPRAGSQTSKRDDEDHIISLMNKYE